MLRSIVTVSRAALMWLRAVKAMALRPVISTTFFVIRRRFLEAEMLCHLQDEVVLPRTRSGIHRREDLIMMLRAAFLAPLDHNLEALVEVLVGLYAHLGDIEIGPNA